MDNKFWILDAGHGGMIDGIYQSAKKFDPGNKKTWNKLWYHSLTNETIFEGVVNRLIVDQIHIMCNKYSIAHHILIPEQKDISLQTRVNRANDLYKVHKNAVYLSIHCNAINKSNQGTGWEVWTSKGYTKSDKIASIFFNEATNEFPLMKMRSGYHDPNEKVKDADKEANFKVLKSTDMPALLTENFFMNNYDPDFKLLNNSYGVKRIANCHIRAMSRCNQINF